MNHVFKSFPLAFKMIFKDPVNLLLSIFPTIIALALYFFTIATVWRNSDRLVATFRGYIYTADQATLLAKVLTGILIVFLFFVMSWTFVIVVGIIAAPFNSALSSRIEKKLVQQNLLPGQEETFTKMKMSLGTTFKNELKKLVFIAVVAVAAFFFNLFPLFYPVGVLLIAILLTVQFVDYSWSRNDIHFGACLKDVLKNILPYAISGFIFVLLVGIPVLNAFVPALATSYFTVLWLYRQNKIQ